MWGFQYRFVGDVVEAGDGQGHWGELPPPCEWYKDALFRIRDLLIENEQLKAQLEEK